MVLWGNAATDASTFLKILGSLTLYVINLNTDSASLKKACIGYICHQYPSSKIILPSVL